MPIQTAHTLPPMTAWIVQYHNSGQSGQSALTPQGIINDNDHWNFFQSQVFFLTK